MFFFFNTTTTTVIYTLSLHDALPISYKHSVPRFFVPEHGTMFTLALVRFPPTATKDIQYLNAKGALTYTDIRSEERFSRNAETDIVCRLLLEKKNKSKGRKAQL